MPTAADIVKELKSLGSESIKKILLKHGIPEPLLGVKVGGLKKIQQRIKKDYQLALDLYDTGIYDAMYLAGLIADDKKMTRSDLQKWADNATSRALCGYTVAWVAAESLHGWGLARKWIDSKKDAVAATGWATLASFASITLDDKLDLPELKRLLDRVQKTILKQPDGVRSAMNAFLLCVATYVKPLSDAAIETARKLGPIPIDVGDTDCTIPYVPDYIEKVRKRNAIGKKRKTAKC